MATDGFILDVLLTLVFKSFVLSLVTNYMYKVGKNLQKLNPKDFELFYGEFQIIFFLFHFLPFLSDLSQFIIILLPTFFGVFWS